MNRKNILLLMLLLVLETGMFAQITITQTDMPNASDSIRVSYSISLVDPTLTGANYTWDFSTLIPDLQTVEVFDAPSSFVTPFNLIFNIFNTSYGLQVYTPDSIGAIQPDNAYNFYKETSSQYKLVGTGLTINSIPLPVLYTNPDIIYQLPINYGNLDSSDALWGLTIPGLGYYGQTIHRVNEVDGWGTLITPFGTVPSLRIKSTIFISDTTYIDSLGIGYSIDRPAKYEYKWLSANCKIPYLEIDANDVAGIPVVTNIIYQDVYQPGVFQLGINNSSTNTIKMSVYPNPTTDIVFVQYQLTFESTIKIELFDLAGRIVYSQLYPKQNLGSNTQILNLENLESGTYLFKISGGSTNTVQKIVVQ